MNILKKGIETDDNNFTRFLIISKTRIKVKNDKTSITFMLKHEPGSLYNALKAFSSNGVNLTKLESRPIIRKPWEYRFYVRDLEGDSEDVKVINSLAELGKVSDSLRVIGSYPKAGMIFAELQLPKKGETSSENEESQSSAPQAEWESGSVGFPRRRTGSHCKRKDSQ